MGTLKVDNLQKRDGTALITDGAASTTLLSQASLRSAGVGMVYEHNFCKCIIKFKFDSDNIITSYRL